MKSTSKFLGTVFLTALFGLQLVAGNYEIDKKKTSVKWTGKKVAGKHHGTIQLQKGILNVEDEKIQAATFEMNMNSIVCYDLESESLNQKLVGHLKSDDFFSVDKFPVSKLELKEVSHKSGDEYTFTGYLTIKGITHPINFDARILINNGELISEGVIEVDRTIYDIKYGSGRFFDNLGDNMIHDTFTLDFNVVAYLTADAETSDNE